MEDTEKNKEKLLALLQNHSYREEEKPEKKEEVKASTVQKVFNSPTPVKSLNLLFWILFIGVDIFIAMIVYFYWL